MYNYKSSAIFKVVGYPFFLCLGVQPLSARTSDLCNHPLHQSSLCSPKPSTGTLVNFTENELYYSGGILHQANISSPNAINLNPQNTKLETKQLNVDADAHPQEVEISHNKQDVRGELYTLFKNKFLMFSKAKKKKIQVCLKRYEPSLKIDGLWGDRTFAAIINSKVPEKKEAPQDKKTVFSALKSIFKGKSSCNTLMTHLLKPSDSKKN
tara:strand:- start:85 stop:714 length:630 start_codon:yes stop_codon:yes gene_type:complete